MSAPDLWMTIRDSITAVWQRCRQWVNAGAASELTFCGEEEVERIARDFRMSAVELRTLAKRGPEAADLLLRRMAALDLDRNEVIRTQSRTFQDLQRVCIMCQQHRRCAGDLARDFAIPAWKDYCANAPTLMALNALPWAARCEW